MFTYCLNNPVCRKDISGTVSVAIFTGEGDVDHSDDDQDIHGGKMPENNSISGNSPGNGGNNTQTLPKNNTYLEANEALELAEDYLGYGYIEVAPGRFVSLDGMRQIRMGPNDLLGMHGGGPHINFDRLSPSYKTSHVYFWD